MVGRMIRVSGSLWHVCCQLPMLVRGVFCAFCSLQGDCLLEALAVVFGWKAADRGNCNKLGELGSSKFSSVVFVGADQALRYARAAAAVRACQYKIDTNITEDDMPFVAEASCLQIRQILTTGTCDQLTQFRSAFHQSSRAHMWQSLHVRKVAGFLSRYLSQVKVHL